MPNAKQNYAAASIPTGAVRVLLVEDHAFVRELIATLLEREAGRYRIVAEAATVGGAVTACREHRPDLLVLDLNLAGGGNGTAAMATLRRAHPPARILVCSGSCDEAEIAAALRAGPDGFVDKNAHTEVFLAAAAAVAAGGRYLCPRSARVFAEMGQGRHGGPDGRVKHVTRGQPRSRGAAAGPPPTVLTPREREVLVLVAGGRTSKEAAEALGISLGTVVSHRANLMRKLGLHNAAELASYVTAHGVQPRDRRR